MIVFGGPLGEAIADKAHLGDAFNVLWGILRWPAAFVVVLLLFALIYYLAPNQAQRDWKWVTPGSLLGALLWLALSGLFALYTSFTDSYSKTYGSLAGGIVLLLWLNYTAWAVLFGAELNSEMEHQTARDTTEGPPKPLGARGATVADNVGAATPHAGNCLEHHREVLDRHEACHTDHDARPVQPMFVRDRWTIWCERFHIHALQHIVHRTTDHRR